MTYSKKEHILAVIGILLILIAIVGGYFSIGKPGFFYFSLAGMAYGAIALYFSLKKQRKTNNRISKTNLRSKTSS